MAGRILFCLRRRLLSASISPFYHIIQSHSLITSKYALSESPPTIISQRSFSWWGGHSRKPDPKSSHKFNQEQEEDKEEEHQEHGNERPEPLTTESETFGSGFEDVTNVLDNSLAMENASHGIGMGWHTPVEAMIAFLDGFHNLTGLPWWLSIVASTVVIRSAMLPLSILQMIKTSSILKMRSKLEPFLPMPGSDFLRQYALFTHQRRAMGCPTFLWFFATPAIQMPVFFCSMFAVRWMCTDFHPGFDNGGAMWFLDLTEHIHGSLGALFPISTAGIFLLNVQLSLGGLEVVHTSRLLDVIRKYYQIYLKCLTVPVFIVGFYMPQGVLIFMLTNSTFSTMQILLQKHLAHSMMLGLSAHQKNPKIAQAIRQLRNGEMTDKLSSADLLMVSAQHVAGGHLESALQLLRVAIEKDPERSESYIAMGTIQLKKKLYDEAAKQFELAISKATSDNVLVAAHLYAGNALLYQEKMVEAIAHLRKITALEEPADPKSKDLYYRGLVLLASILFKDGKKEEAAQYLRIAAKYDPSVNVYLQECEETKDIEQGR
ncbi:ALBINO3-like protein 2, chloroplastic isoform X2 [Cryptomeria japonica]|uniref:ALBINO3-like protein 2, chloroplastic isoform X2 n=1 Tax=Cryptomeria japonica TaxID=3369 RepID=UPI0025AB9090|nr:ALBINO3-like protein 2, chloroplastic isoform X2 [Cryptomeria japonica]